MEITLEQLIAIMPYARQRAGFFLDSINETMDEAYINTVDRAASFLSQIAHESVQLRYVEEIASGEAYEGRIDLGNTEVGDGIKYKGRGLIQVTGRANYAACGDELCIDLINYPDMLKMPQYAARSAGWFWTSHNLNTLADTKDQRRVTKRVNGGYNGYNSRLAFYNKAMQVL